MVREYEKGIKEVKEKLEQPESETFDAVRELERRQEVSTPQVHGFVLVEYDTRSIPIESLSSHVF